MLAGVEGPILFVYATAGQNRIPGTLQGYLSRYGLLKESCVICTTTAYLTENRWLGFVCEMCLGIRAVEVIKDHNN